MHSTGTLPVASLLLYQASYHGSVPDVDSIRKFCLSFADATENMQWGEDLCFKVHGKIFAVIDLSKGKLAPISFKCTTEKFQELLEIEGIAPAPYEGDTSGCFWSVQAS